MPFTPGCAPGPGRPVSLSAAVARMADDAEKIQRAIADHQRKTIASILLGQDPPPLPDNYPTENERLTADLRHLRALLATMQRRLEALPHQAQPARKRRSAGSAEADARALELAEAELAREERAEEVRLLSAGALLDRATPKSVAQ